MLADLSSGDDGDVRSNRVGRVEVGGQLEYHDDGGDGDGGDGGDGDGDGDGDDDGGDNFDSNDYDDDDDDDDNVGTCSRCG